MGSLRTGDIVGEYRVVGMAGSGGMGAVYKIEHLITKRIEAMKLLPPGSSDDPGQVQRFEREIQVQARLHHPNIAALYNAIHQDGSVALVMEFVEGESLQRMLEAGPLPVDTAVDFACQILSALAYAHTAGVIHRDVAPANIIISPGGGAKLTDFGLARGSSDLRLSTSGVPLGSPWYMSPEQVRGLETLDARTDIYAMGAVLHEMLTGGKLFEAGGAFAVMRAHVEAEPVLPSTRNPNVPPALDGIVRKAVEKNPAQRFQSADEFRLALQGAVTVPAPAPIPPPRRSRHRLASGATVLALALAPAAWLSTHRSRTDDRRASSVHSIPLPPPPPPPPLVVPQLPPPVVAEVPGQKPPSPLPQARPRPIRHAANPPQNAGIRITGGESPVAAAPFAAKPESAELLPEPPPVPGEGAPPDDPALPDLAPTKPPSRGNRLIKALGKINPFRNAK